jgi:hypothetical protein
MSDGYDFSDAEKRDIIKLITEGKPLPEKYRFLLFQDIDSIPQRPVRDGWHSSQRALEGISNALTWCKSGLVTACSSTRHSTSSW